jgi:adenylate cyclase
VDIHFGEAALGRIGSEKRLEHTAIGDSVNTTKRIQESAAVNRILISRIAYEPFKKIVNVRKYAPLAVKGKSQPAEVLEVLGLK